MFNKDVVLREAALAVRVFCMFSTLIAVAVVLGLAPYSLLPYELLSGAIIASAYVMIIVLCEGGRS